MSFIEPVPGFRRVTTVGNPLEGSEGDIRRDDGIPEILILQPKGSEARPYQVKQVRNVILKYRLAGDL